MGVTDSRSAPCAPFTLQNRYLDLRALETWDRDIAANDARPSQHFLRRNLDRIGLSKQRNHLCRQRWRKLGFGRRKNCF